MPLGGPRPRDLRGAIIGRAFMIPAAVAS